MQTFVTMPNIPTNPYIAGLITEPPNPNPVRWSAEAPLKVFFDDTGVRAWTDVEKAAAMAAFASWQKVANISFELTTVRAEANILQILNESETVLGSTTAPADGVNPPTINYSIFNNAFTYLQPGGDTFSTLVHEIGHSIGLYHPHSGTTFPGVPLEDDQNTGTNGQNQHIWTTMSYAAGWTGEPRTTLDFGTNAGPMTFDIAAIQFLYGVRAAETGDNTYTLPMMNQAGTGWNAIWDTGGTDTITGAGANTDLTINLLAAPLTGANAGGYVSWIAGIQGGFTIANTVVIENAIGGNGNDTLVGNAANNILTGGAGNDSITGSGGFDIARVNANRADATIASINNGHRITTPNDGTDTLMDVDRVQFNDAFLALDVALGEIAGSAYRIYKAAFARTPDEGGVSFWVKFMDAGNTLLAVANNFLASDEFKTIYGTSPSAGDFVARLYQNVLGREGEAGGVTFWTGEITSGNRTMGKVLADFAESPENVAGVQASIADGFWYV